MVTFTIDVIMIQSKGLRSGEGESAVVGSSDLPAKVTFNDKTGWGLGRRLRLSSR